MLQRVEIISWKFIRHSQKRFLREDLFLDEGHLRLQIGKLIYNFPVMHGIEEVNKFLARLKQCDTIPYQLKCGKDIYWFFRHKFYKDTDNLKAEEVAALLITREKLKEGHINRARTIAALVTQPEKVQRGNIPEDVKLLVWERDRGKCKKCGSNVDLQFDHIIPFSLGGSSTPENLQILCGKCNRLKSASII